VMDFLPMESLWSWWWPAVEAANVDPEITAMVISPRRICLRGFWSKYRETAVSRTEVVERAALSPIAMEKDEKNWEGKKDWLGTYRERSPLSLSALPYESEYLHHCGTERRGQDDLCARIPAELR